MTPGRKVFIPNLTFHDYNDAKRFGQLVALSKGSIDSISLEHATESFKDKLREHEAHPDDHVLISGAPFLNAITCGIFLHWFGHVRVLQWNGILKEYDVHVVELEDKE